MLHNDLMYRRTHSPQIGLIGPVTQLAKRVIACLDVRANDQGDLVVTKGDQYDVRDKVRPGRPCRWIGILAGKGGGVGWRLPRIWFKVFSYPDAAIPNFVVPEPKRFGSPFSFAWDQIYMNGVIGAGRGW
jgi:hypothetical protein